MVEATEPVAIVKIGEAVLTVKTVEVVVIIEKV
jgi:hypothetical protein